jgi:hypothetical protein
MDTFPRAQMTLGISVNHWVIDFNVASLPPKVYQAIIDSPLIQSVDITMPTGKMTIVADEQKQDEAMAFLAICFLGVALLTTQELYLQQLMHLGYQINIAKFREIRPNV